MNLSNLIELIAEVAARRTAREGKTKTVTPDQAWMIFQPIVARVWQEHRFSPGA